MEKFFAKHLGGRIQNEVPADIQKKLEAITVDITTVTMPEKPAAVSSGTKAKFNPALIKEGVTKFQTNLSMRGQEFKISSIQTITKGTIDGKNIIRVVETSSGAMGSTSDSTEFDGTTLYPISQRSQQGPASLTFTFTDKSVNGSMKANGQTMPITAVLTEPTLPSSSSSGAIIATLPFNEGYSTTVTMFDVMSATAKKYDVKVLAKEKIAIAKGAFDAYKVAMTPSDGDGIKFTYWITISTSEIVKTEATLLAMMGGGTMVGELQ